MARPTTRTPASASAPAPASPTAAAPEIVTPAPAPAQVPAPANAPAAQVPAKIDTRTLSEGSVELRDVLAALALDPSLDGLKVPSASAWRSAVKARIGFELSAKDRKEFAIRDCNGQDTLTIAVLQVLTELGIDTSAYQFSRRRDDGSTATVNARSLPVALVTKVTRTTEMRSMLAGAASR